MSEKHKRKDARKLLSRMGYKSGGHMHHADEAEDKVLIKKEMKKARIKLKTGGVAEGDEPKPRADRLARGGNAHKGKKGGHTTVNVVVGGQHPQPVPVPVPKPVPVPVGGGGMPPPGAGGTPPGMGPQGPMPPTGMKKGGRTRDPIDSQRDAIKGLPMGHFKKGGRTKAKYPVPMTEGAGGGLGRLKKIKDYGAKV